MVSIRKIVLLQLQYTLTVSKRCYKSHAWKRYLYAWKAFAPANPLFWRPCDGKKHMCQTSDISEITLISELRSIIENCWITLSFVSCMSAKRLQIRWKLKIFNNLLIVGRIHSASLIIIESIMMGESNMHREKNMHFFAFIFNFFITTCEISFYLIVIIYK